MIPQELKAWRIDQKLTHQEAADLLGASSRYVIIRWENGSELAAGIADKVAEATKLLLADRAQALSRPQPITSVPKGAHRERSKVPPLPHGARTLTMAIQPIWRTEADEQAPNYCYWSFGWKDRKTGAPHYNMLQIDDLAGKGLCTPLFLDAGQWLVYQHHSYKPFPLVDNLNGWLRGNQLYLDSIPFSLWIPGRL